MANLPETSSSVALCPTYSETDLVSQKSNNRRSNASTTSFLRGWGPSNSAVTTVDPKANLELTYPLLHKFLNKQLDWDPPLQLLKATLQIINDKRVFRKKTDAAQFEELKQLYREWWILIRNHQSLQNSSVRKLAKFVKDFIVAALEDASYAVKMAVLGTEKLARLSGRYSSVASWKSEHDKKPAHKISSQFSQIASVVDASTSETPKTESALKTSASGRLNTVDAKPTQAHSKVAITTSQLHLPIDVSVDAFATAMKSMATEDEVYMQIIVKDILSDISSRENERQKKLLQASDEAARGHRSSATTLEHSRLPFSSKRLSGKTIKSRIPVHSIKTSKIVGSLLDTKHSARHATGFGFGSVLEASFLRNELREKIENIKLRNDRQDLAATGGAKSIKEKVHLKLRANNTRVQNYVRPLGKK